jgi:hypothetical protein
MKRMLLTLGLAAAQAGCVHAGASVYASGEGGPQGYEQPASASYGVPAAAPKGTVYIVSLGGEQLPVNNGTGVFMHVRIAGQNDSDTATWRFDPNEQALRLEGAATPEAASFAEASTGGPVLTLAPGQRGQLDLYYSMPAQSGPQRTTLEWHVRRGDESLAFATSFERPAGVAAQEASPYYYQPVYDARLHFAFGPGWWWGYDYWPFYYGFYAPFYRPWWGPRFYGHGYYAPHRYYGPSRAYGGRGYYGGGRGYSAPPSSHVGRGGFRRR